MLVLHRSSLRPKQRKESFNLKLKSIWVRLSHMTCIHSSLMKALMGDPICQIPTSHAGEHVYLTLTRALHWWCRQCGVASSFSLGFMPQVLGGRRCERTLLC